MFQNANHTSLSEFTKEDLLVRLNSNTDQLIDINHIANNGAELVIDHLQWNNTAHFDLTYTPWKHLGFKMVVAGLSKNAGKRDTTRFGVVIHYNKFNLFIRCIGRVGKWSWCSM